MPRVSKQKAAEHHEAAIAAAARLFKAHGIDGVSVPELMAEVGLTHGAFYGHFKSKEALAIAAWERAFAEKRTLLAELLDLHGGDKRAALAAFVNRYTTKAHRDQPALGCPVAALADDAAREPFKGQLRKTFAAGVESLVEGLQTLLGARGKSGRREEALADVALLVGALVISRATKGQPISEEILEAARGAALGD